MLYKMKDPESLENPPPVPAFLNEAVIREINPALQALREEEFKAAVSSELALEWSGQAVHKADQSADKIPQGSGKSVFRRGATGGM